MSSDPKAARVSPYQKFFLFYQGIDKIPSYRIITPEGLDREIPISNILLQQLQSPTKHKHNFEMMIKSEFNYLILVTFSGEVGSEEFVSSLESVAYFISFGKILPSEFFIPYDNENDNKTMHYTLYCRFFRKLCAMKYDQPDNAISVDTDWE